LGSGASGAGHPDDGAQGDPAPASALQVGLGGAAGGRIGGHAGEDRSEAAEQQDGAGPAEIKGATMVQMFTDLLKHIHRQGFAVARLEDYIQAPH